MGLQYQAVGVASRRVSIQEQEGCGCGTRSGLPEVACDSRVLTSRPDHFLRRRARELGQSRELQLSSAWAAHTLVAAHRSTPGRHLQHAHAGISKLAVRPVN